VSEYGMEKGSDGDCMPLSTHPQRYCDPASLVTSFVLRVVNKA